MLEEQKNSLIAEIDAMGGLDFEDLATSEDAAPSAPVEVETKAESAPAEDDSTEDKTPSAPPRGDGGKFATKETEAGAKAEEPDPALTPEVTEAERGEHRVPVGRLNDVIGQRNALRNEKAKLEAEMAELRLAARVVQHIGKLPDQAQPSAPAGASDAEFNPYSYFNTDDLSLVEPWAIKLAEENWNLKQGVGQVESLRQQFDQSTQAQKLAEATASLTAEVDGVLADFPQVPRRYVIERIAADHTLSAQDIAVQFMDMAKSAGWSQAQQAQAAEAQAVAASTPSRAPPRPGHSPRSVSTIGESIPDDVKRSGDARKPWLKDKLDRLKFKVDDFM